MSEKNNDEAEQGNPLRPIPPTRQPSQDAQGAGWMQSLGVDGASAPEPGPSTQDEDPPQPRGSWMDQLGEPGTGSGDSVPEPGPAVEEPRRESEAGHTRRPPAWVLPVVLVAVAVALVGGIGLLIASSMPGGEQEEPTDLASDLAEIEGASTPEASAPAPSTSSSPTKAGFECEESKSGSTLTGAGSGDTTSVAGVVLAFQHAYYIDRDAKKALELTAEDSPLVNAEALQEGIDSVPRGTKHCVSVTTDGDTARVEVTEARPSDTPVTFESKVTTSRDGDRVEIVDISEGE